MTSEFIYPAGHNWEGLTQAQVNEGYINNPEKIKLQGIMKEGSGVEVRFEILGEEDKV